MQSYPLDLKTLLHILSRQKQTGELVANDVRVPRSRKPGRAYLALIDGNVEMETCVITVDKQIILKGIDAFQYLQKAGVLEWIYTAQTASMPPQALVPSKNMVPLSQEMEQEAWFPIRIRIVSMEEFGSSPAPLLYRSVYNISDGEKSVEEIAQVLGKPVEMIEEILAVLYKRRAIDLLHYRQRDRRW